MLCSYNKSFQPRWHRHCSDGGRRTHQAIAALICDQPDKNPYTAILSTGTRHNDAEKCGFTSACDGHAISVIYEAAPDYFKQEMINLRENNLDSIFKYVSPQDAKQGFRLKDHIKFHLLVTQPPCGFICDQEDPCMEWKTPFVGYPHVPKCSSRIFIGAKMGIQGYVSHLIKNPILIESITILCGKDKGNQRIDFGNMFRLPQIKVLEYDPTYFQKDFRGSKLKLKHASNISSDTYENVDRNESATSAGTSEDGTNKSAVTVTNLDRNLETSFLIFNPQKDETSSTGLPIKTKVIEKYLEVDEQLEMKRKRDMKLLYTDLMDDLRVKEALTKLKMKLATKIEKNSQKIQGILDSISAENKKAAHRLDTDNLDVDMWNCILNEFIKPNYVRLKEQGIKKILNQKMIACVDTLLSNESAGIVMDCSWHDYVHVVFSSYQTTEQ